MKAIRIHAPGGSNTLLYEETEEPKKSAPTDVIVIDRRGGPSQRS